MLEVGLLLGLMVVSVVLITSDRRTSIEESLRERHGIDRNWWVPPVALVVGAMTSILGWASFRTAVLQKFDIIVLIFAFGILARGMGASGLFRHLAYRVVERCRGHTRRLVLAVFCLTSAVTLVTSNDIVILVMTPIIVEICFQAGIRNTRPVLLAQFIAANTLSMGLLIGSPTNIILAEALAIDFLEYLGLMLLPALVAFGSSFLLLRWMLERGGDWLRVTERYQIPHHNPEPAFTGQMRDWLVIFGIFIVLVAVVTHLQVSLLYCAVPAIALALGYWHRSDTHETRVLAPVRQLPFGILFFGMTFFTFAEAVGRTGFVGQQLVPFLSDLISSSPAATPFIGIFGSGMLVNTFNDLPAAALLAELLPRLGIGRAAVETVLTQASLVGLNLGTYVTPIGALAGLIWFDRMRVQHQRERAMFPDLATEIELPDRHDLVRFGLTHLVVTGIAVGLFLTIELMVLSALA